MTQEVFEYIKQCPQFTDFSFNIDYLGRKPYSASLSGRCEEKTLKKYTDGDSMHKSTYILKLRLPFGADGETNCENSMLLENVSRWFRKNNADSFFPLLDEKNIAVSVSCDVSRNYSDITPDSCVVDAKIGIVYYRVR